MNSNQWEPRLSAATPYQISPTAQLDSKWKWNTNQILIVVTECLVTFLSLASQLQPKQVAFLIKKFLAPLLSDSSHRCGWGGQEWAFLVLTDNGSSSDSSILASLSRRLNRISVLNNGLRKQVSKTKQQQTNKQPPVFLEHDFYVFSFYYILSINNGKMQFLSLPTSLNIKGVFTIEVWIFIQLIKHALECSLWAMHLWDWRIDSIFWDPGSLNGQSQKQGVPKQAGGKAWGLKYHDKFKTKACGACDSLL